jgi:hypothetical protein
VQYLERKLEGEQSCDNRIARIKETEKENRIKQLKEDIETEDIVFETIKTHLTQRKEELVQKVNAREKLRESAVNGLDKKLEDIKLKSDNTLTEISQITEKIDEDRKERTREEAEEEYKAKIQ